jgi:hypothetical protein
MIFDLYGETLVVWVKRRPTGHGPGFEDAVQFEPKIIVQPRGVVLLDDEAPAVRRPDGFFPARFPGFLEIALGFVGRKVVIGHERLSGTDCR